MPETKVQTPTCIGVISGKHVDLLDFQASDLNMYDVAWSLAGQNRYLRHTPISFDTLSHTGLCYMLYVNEVKGQIDPVDAACILLHDAAEAYVGDMTKPLKSIMPEYCAIEDAILKVILAVFGISWERFEESPWKRYDKQALWVEHTTFNRLPDKIYGGPVYEMAKRPPLIRARVQDYINQMKEIATRIPTYGPPDMFAFPEALEGYLDTVEEVIAPVRDEPAIPSPNNSDILGMSI